MHIDQIEGSLSVHNGVNHVNWDVVEKWVQESIPECDRPHARTVLAGQWLQKLAGQFGYCVASSQNYLLLSRFSDERTAHLLRRLEGFLCTIVDVVPLARLNDQIEKLPLLIFAAPRPYYRYLSPFMPDAETRHIEGMFVPGVCPHIVALARKRVDDRMLVHELIHACFHHLPLPLWLNEGLTQACEDTVFDSSDFLMTPQAAEKQRSFWRDTSLTPFWDGSGFVAASDLAGHCYLLAQILVRNMFSDFPGQFETFIANATSEDGGERAAREVFGVGLAERVAQFLGPGDWQPRITPTDDSAR